MRILLGCYNCSDGMHELRDNHPLQQCSELTSSVVYIGQHQAEGAKVHKE